MKGFPENFVANALYTPEAWFLHELLEVDREGGRVVAQMDTTQLGELVAAQRTETGHARHVPAACVIQSTGVLGNVHSQLILGLAPEEGWYGYGTRIREARFHKMGVIGPPVIATLVADRTRCRRGTWFCEYSFTYTQDGELFYTSSQSAVWLRDSE